MASNFVQTVDTVDPRDPPDTIISQANPMEGLPGAVEAISDYVDGRRLDNAQAALSEAESALANEDNDYLSQKKKAQYALYQSMQAKNNALISHYSEALQNLALKEQQRRASPTGAQIQRDTLLKAYINRYPHLEEQFRQMSSSTRASAQATKIEAVEDPVEEGLNAARKAAAQAGLSVADYMKQQQEKEDTDIKTKRIAMKAALGQNVENDVEVAFNAEYASRVQRNLAALTSSLSQQMLSSGGKFDAADAERQLQLAKQAAMNEVAAQLMSLRGDKEVALSSGFVSRKISDVGKMYDDFSQYLGNKDALAVIDRANKLSAANANAIIFKYNPALAVMFQNAPEQISNIIFKDFDNTYNAVVGNQRSRIEALIQNAPDYMQKTSLQMQLAFIDGFGTEGFVRDVASAIDTGAISPSQGNPELDASRVLNLLANAEKLPEGRERSNLIGASIDAVAQDSGTTSVPTVFYKNPNTVEAIRKDPALKEKVKSVVDKTVAQFDRSMVQDVIFKKDIKAEQTAAGKGLRPWDAYTTGGPFSSSKNSPSILGALVDADDARAGLSGDGTRRFSKETTQTRMLNNNYWAVERVYGSAYADGWAKELMESFSIGNKQPSASDAVSDPGAGLK